MILRFIAPAISILVVLASSEELTDSSPADILKITSRKKMHLRTYRPPWFKVAEFISGIREYEKSLG